MAAGSHNERTTPIETSADVHVHAVPSLWLWMALLVRRTRLLVLGAVLGLLGAVLLSTWRPVYLARTTFAPDAWDAPQPAVAGIAAQLGINLGGGKKGESADFYASLVRSRSLLSALATTSVGVPEDSVRAPLVDILGIEGPSEDARVASAARTLTGMITATVDARTSMVTVEVRTRWQSLSEQIAQEILDLVSSFNQASRQSRAAAERAFVAGRVTEVRAQLDTAERTLERFLDQNRSYEGSAELRFQYGRLQRRVDVATQVYSTLAQALEQARIDEVRNTPVITIIDPPRGSGRRARSTLAMAFYGLLGGGFAGVTLALALEYARIQRDRHDADYRLFEAEWARLRRRGSPGTLPSD